MIPRRNFITWAAGVIGSLTSIALLLRKNDKRKETGKKTAKMLTRDGKLVEVDIQHLQSNVRLASKKEIQTWVWPEAGASSKPTK
jgi:hypothetical protein